MDLRTTRLLVVFLLIASAASAQDLSGYEKLLLPAFSPAPVNGLNGSTFATHLRGYTEVDTSFYAGLPPGSTSGSGTFVTLQALSQIFAPLNYGPVGPSGRFLYVEKAKLADLTLQYYLTSTSGSDAPQHIAALPIVRTPFIGVTRILGIPNDPILEWPTGTYGFMRGYTYRNTLRIYDFDGNGSGEVTVERFREGLNDRIGSSLGKSTVKLDRRDGDDATYPYFGQIDDLNICLPFSVHTPCDTLLMRIEVVPVTSGLRYYPLVSSTNNSTSEVAIFAPQLPPTN